jgi:predicted Zn-dependent peptidase
MEEIRVKRGLAYSAYSRMNINRGVSYFSGYLQTKNESRDEAIKVTKDIISNFVKKGVSMEELQAAKQFIIGSEPLRNENLSQRLSTTYNEFINELPLGKHKTDLEKIDKLTLEEINEFIKSHSEITKLTFSVVCR